MFDPIAECERSHSSRYAFLCLLLLEALPQRSTSLQYSHRHFSKPADPTHQCASRTVPTVAENGASNGHLPCESSGCADCVESVPTRSNSEQIVVG